MRNAVNRIITAKNLTESDIRALRSEAAEDGDVVMIVLCRRALGERVDWEDYSGGGHSRSEMTLIRDAAEISQTEALGKLLEVDRNA